MELQTIQNKIHEIRGMKVMLDFDLAEMYGTDLHLRDHRRSGLRGLVPHRRGPQRRHPRRLSGLQVCLDRLICVLKPRSMANLDDFWLELLPSRVVDDTFSVKA